MQMSRKRWPWFAGAALSLLAAGYNFLWIISSASLASGYCGGKFSLFAEEFRCRQPHLAMLLTAVFAGAFVHLVLRGVRAGRRSAA